MLGTRLGLGKEALSRQSAEALSGLKQVETTFLAAANKGHTPNFGTWAATPKGVSSLGLLKNAKHNGGVGFENARRYVRNKYTPTSPIYFYPFPSCKVAS